MSAVNSRDSATVSRAAPSLLARLLERSIPPVAFGRLSVTLPSGEAVTRSGTCAGPEARMVIHRPRALGRIVLDGEIGFVDGYLDGEWSTPDLPALLSFLLANEDSLRPRRRASGLTALCNRIRHALHVNTRGGSRRNIAAHYDLGNAFYERWLDAGMNYSSALYHGRESLEDAQDAKIERIVDLLELQGRERVLEIGCGWGALAQRIAPKVAYTGITLSTEQRDFAIRRLAADGADAPDVRLQDYRDVRDTYDRIVSIEMFEAVGERYWQLYFERLRAALSTNGIAVLQVITIAASRFPAYRRRPDFIQRHIFPGGMLPTMPHLEALAEGCGLAIVESQSFGMSYAETLREWRSRFTQAWPSIGPLGFNERFRRMWEYYLAYCETGFRHQTIDVSLLKLVPERGKR